MAHRDHARRFILLGGINAALAVGSGAFGAHILAQILTGAQLTTFKTAVYYHMIHALGMVLAGLMASHSEKPRMLLWSCWMFLAGIVLFCGSLHGLLASAPRWIGIFTPVGGFTFMAAWMTLGIGGYRANNIPKVPKENSD
ncbi:MAG: DUF423 domain-containing protein [Magnetococcales bacterium]|nr:DUF423 domain-containing protein [Magnetococcales bacterium]